MTDDERDLLAGEYVLGTLQGDVRAAVQRAMAVDPALATAVRAWEERLAPLAGLVPPVTPSPAVWAGIRRAIGDEGSLDVVPTPLVPDERPPAERRGRRPAATDGRSEPRLDAEPEPPEPTNVVSLKVTSRDRFDAPPDLGGDLGADLGGKAPPEAPADSPDPKEKRGKRGRKKEPVSEADAVVLRLRRRVTFWRRATTAMGILAAGLAGVVWLGSLPTPERPGTRFVAVVNAGGTEPALIVAVDTVAGTVAVRPVAAERPADQSLELWYIPEGQAPRSLGLVDPGGPVQEIEYPSFGRGAAGATLAVSVEPPGGAPGGTPTGPVVYSGRLIPDPR